MSKIQEKIKVLMDDLQEDMENQIHISNPSKVLNQVDRVSLYWSHMNDEDKDYIHAVRFAIEEDMEWKV